ncbi:tRNA(adenine34) deaminase [Collariella sp. IMI 366227]|nr:tRNA(adenine34) deaminase [Collariella sp. IMI 366227]
MAFFKALTGVGLKTTAFLQSLFLVPFNTFLQVVSTPDATQLSEGISRLNLAENGSPNPQLSLSAANGTNKQITGAENDPASMDGSTATEVVARAAPIPLTHAISQTSKLKETVSTIQLGSEKVQIQSKIETPEQAAERAMHSRFMREALDMAKLALRTNETPVGCVLVYKNRVIARGMNATNVTRNGTRHAELMAISALLSFSPASDLEASPEKSARRPLGDKTNAAVTEETSTWGDVDPRDGHLFPYGQKLHPAPRVDPTVIHECTLYVTVEPCVMCASLLRQFGIKKVFFGAVNDKFGGTGGVFRIHKNSPHSMASAPPSPAPQNGKGLVRPILEPRPASAAAIMEEKKPMDEAQNDDSVPVTPMEIQENCVSATPFDSCFPTIAIDTSSLPGDGGNIERGYEAEGGWGRDEAVTLLRQFYVQENNRAPVPRKKEGRAARLAAIMERDGHAGGPMSEAPKIEEKSGVDTPDAEEPVAENIAEAVEPAVATAA